MIVYRIVFEGAQPPQTLSYHATLAQAHAAAKARNKATYHLVFIEVIFIDVDKEAIVSLLNNGLGERGARRCWALTARGGLRETADLAAAFRS